MVVKEVFEIKLEISTNRHSVYNLKYHLVLVTKYRKECINEILFNRLKEITLELFNKWKINLIEINYESDHIHILMEVPPQHQLSKIICSYKTVTARLIRKEFSDYLKKFYWKNYFWNRSYLILTCGGASTDVIKKYIQEQNS